jgi:hypothetical protein
MRFALALFTVSGLAATVLAQGAGLTGPSTTASSYMVPSNPASGVRFTSIATALNTEFHRNLDTGASSYRLVGIPDGMGIYRDADDLANDTFSLLVNHELGDSSGIVRLHGNCGAFVSQWKIRRSDFGVVGARDLSTEYNLFNLASNTFQTFNASNPMPDYAQTAANPQGWGSVNTDGIGRLCSGDLAPVSAFRFTDASGNTFGTQERLFLNGEERGDSGRAFAHVVTGVDARKSFELPDLADFSWENAIASPFAQRKTVVAGTDDSTPGQVYFYVGEKQQTGNDIEKAGLMGGKTYGLRAAGFATEGAAPINVAFDMVDLSASQRDAGSTFQAVSNANNVTNFARPEDGAWNPLNPNEFIWVNTGSSAAPSRIYRALFNDIASPELGGTVTMLGQGNDLTSFSGGFTSATGATGGASFDNMAISRFGQVLIQEDPGNNDRLCRLWLYDLAADSLLEVGVSDSFFFGDSNPSLPGVQALLTRDEESSGIVDAWDIIGPGWWVLNMQAHYGISGELVEGGQLMAVFIPQTVPAPGAAALLGLAGLVATRRRR